MIIGYNHFMKTFPDFVLAMLILILPLAACTTAQTPQPTETPPPISAAPAPTEWLYEDLLLLDPIDALTPDDPDLFALYYQSTEDDWAHIRLDILRDDFSNCQIVLDIADITSTSEANKSPHLVLNISYNNGIWHAVATQSNDSSVINFPILIDEFPETHSVVVSFPEKHLMKERPMEIAIINHAGGLIDSASILSFEPSPPAKAPLLLAFWDALPANTPAQLLQRWDGAHTGPYGSRHGLKHLLAAVEENQVPVALLDLKDPGTLSGLDLIGQIDYIQQLVEQKLLILPETGFTDPEISIEAVGISHKTALEFGFSPSPLAFGNFSVFEPPNYDGFFALLETKTNILSTENQRIVPLPYSPWEDNTVKQVLEANRDGLTRDTWQKLLDIALSPDYDDLLVFGGSLITSPWGDSSIAPAAFQDLVNHPWINPISLKDIQSLPAIEKSPPFNEYYTDYLCTSITSNTTTPNHSISKNSITASIKDLVRTKSSDFAWQMAFQLLRPTYNNDRYEIQSIYWEQLKHLFYASTSKFPGQPFTSCYVDLSHDGENDCVLSPFAPISTFEIADASLITTFHLDDSDTTQWIGPTSQIVVGMSDSIFWDLDAGTYSDPSAIPGSFILDTAEPLTFEVSELDEKHIHFISTDGTISKDYSFSEEALTVTIETDQPLTTDLVLALDPQQRFQPDWAEKYNIFSQTDESFCWGAEDGKAVCVSWAGEPEVEINTFKDSLESLSQPLDPNKIYPPGHFLPMSLATVAFSTDQDFTVTLSPYPNP